MKAPPCFVIGFQRSGTTLLRVMLDNHPEMAVPLDTVGLWANYEAKLPDYEPLFEEANRRRLIGDLLREERIRLWGVLSSVEEVERHITRPGLPGVMDGFHTAYAAAHGKTRWGDKDPGNMVRLDRINRWFPDARVLHIIRDGRDACLSLVQQEFGPSDVLACANQWREQLEWVRRIGGILGPARYHEVLYENLVSEPEGELREICAFLDLEYSPAMLGYHQHLEASVPESKRHIWPLLAQPPRSDNAAKWMQAMSPGMRLCFEKRAGWVLKELGYSTISDAPHGAYLTEFSVQVRRLRQMIRAHLPRMSRSRRTGR